MLTLDPRRVRGLPLLLMFATTCLTGFAFAKDPDYARFAKGEWKTAFASDKALQGARNAVLKDGVVSLDDGFARDSSAGAMSAKDMIVRAKVRGRGALFVRGPTENYIAWLGGGMVGVNKYGDRQVHVLAMREAALDATTFHELALAAVGDRVIVFLDGRRLLDVVDQAAQNAAAAALQSHQTKADFKDVEVMSLDGLDAGKLLPDRDPLAKGLGTWDVTRTLTVNGQPPQESTGVMHVERPLGDFYVVRGTASDGSSSLFVTQFIPQETAIRTWVFMSSGHMDQYDKALDLDTGTQTIPPRPAKNGVMSGVIRPLDADKGESRFKTVGPDGKLVAEFVSINRRRAQAGGPPSLRADGPAPEMAALAPYVGRWSMEVRTRPSKFEPRAKVEAMQDETEWILGGRFLMRFERNPGGELLNLHVAGYDPAAKTFIFTAFQAAGRVMQWNTHWDPGTKSFLNKVTGLPQGWTWTGGDRVVGPDTLEGGGLLKDGQGATVWDATVTRRRKN